MSQSFEIPIAGTQDLKTSRVKINSALQALQSSFSGASAPSSPVRGQGWLDTVNDKLMLYDGSSWVAVITDVTAAGGGAVARDGTVALTGDLDAGSNRLKAVASATVSTDAPNAGQVAARPLFAPCHLGDVSETRSALIFVAGSATTVLDVSLSTVSNTSSSGTDYWTANVAVASSGADLRASDYSTDADGELTSGVRNPLGLDQNLTLGAGNVLRIDFTKFGSPSGLIGVVASVEYTTGII